ncbi:MAG: glycosyltransferase, partial [Candidatus Omnitrophica bacterium]|nr:glycosyltransferase [Candidatus Omnitrophota bacterium]
MYITGLEGKNVVPMVFICEATDEKWKAVDTGRYEEAHFGVFGKRTEGIMKKTIADIKQRWLSDYPSSERYGEYPRSQYLIEDAFEALELKAYNRAIEYAKKCIEIWGEIADKQQVECEKIRRFPSTKITQFKVEEIFGGRTRSYTREIFNYWALNDVGTSYYIIGRALYEQGKQTEAKKIFEIMLKRYSYAQIAEDKEKTIISFIYNQNGTLRETKTYLIDIERSKKIRYFKLSDLIIKVENNYLAPYSFSSQDLTFEAWRFLLNKDYEKASAYANKCIELYSQEAKRQEDECRRKGLLPKGEDIWNYWALNDVGACYFIKIRALIEQGRVQEAKQIYQDLKTHFQYAQLRDLKGNYWKVVYGVERNYPELLDSLIPNDIKSLSLYSLGTLIAIIMGRIFLKISERFGQRDKVNFKIEEESVMDWKDRVIFSILLFLETFSLFRFISFWIHPERWLHYTVNFYLFCSLSLVGFFFIGFYLYVWYLLWSMKRPKYVPPEEGKRVAMVTTYIENEPLELVKETLIKMRDVRYPHDTFVLDESNNPELKEFCNQNGIIHFSRKNVSKYNQPKPPFQEKTKGGNLNAWLDSNGYNYEFVTFLDPDHQPKENFLDRVLGYFRDSRIGFVQAPHIYKNIDESWVAKGGAEQNYYFVGPIQLGLYGNQCCIVNGSHSTFRISALKDIGGYAVHNADDVLTSLRLYARGWKGIYVPEVLASGLTPNNWKDYLIQQYRWANSMFDLLLFHYPRLLLHLRLSQILGYLMLGTYYFFAINFIILLILPSISTILAQAVVNVNLFIFLQCFMAFYIAKMAFLIFWSQKFLLRREEQGFWWRSGLLMIAASPYIFYAFLRAILKKGLLRTKFVTPKEGERKRVSYIRFFYPHILLISFSTGVLIYSILQDPVLWTVRGMRLFLIIGIITLDMIAISSTKWFGDMIEFIKRNRDKILRYVKWTGLIFLSLGISYILRDLFNPEVMMLKTKLMPFIFLSLAVITVNRNEYTQAEVKNFKDEIQIKDDWLYLKGRKFFINSVGYAPWRPGQWPGKDRVDLKLIEEDFKRIKEANFNSVRTWDALSPEELALAKKYGLKVIQGIWIDPTRDFSDSYFVRDSLDYIRRVVEWSKDYDNVIMYLVITEPKQEAVLYADIDRTLEFFRKIKETIQNIDDKPVSMDSWIPIGFLDHSLWDVVTFNAFMFTPESINRTMGFRKYVRWFKKTHAQNKPLFIGETGGFSVSKRRLNNIGFGGNTEEKQAKGNIESIQESILAGATGVCTVAWVDTWHYPSDPSTHDNHPWEWDGLLEFRNRNDMIGFPRKTYYALKKFNKQELKSLLNKRKNEQKVDLDFTINLHPKKKSYKVGDKIELEMTLLDPNGRPLRNKRVDIGFFLPVGWKEEIKSKFTDKEGNLTVECGLVPDDRDQYLIVSAGILIGKRKSANLIFVRLESTQVKEEGFFIYQDKDSPKNHFYPTGWTGDYEDLRFDDSWEDNSYSGKTCIKIEYSARMSLGGGWAGIYWQNPAFNWDREEGGMDLRRMKRLSFWIRGEEGGERIEEIGLGGSPPNSTKVNIGSIVLNKEWQKLNIDLAGENLENIINGFYFFLRKDSNPSGCTFYLDDIKYEEDSNTSYSLDGMHHASWKKHKEYAKRFLNWIIRNSDIRIGLPHSHVGDDRFKEWSITYDSAVVTLAYIASGRTEKAKKVIDFYIDTPNVWRLGGIIEAVCSTNPALGEDWSVRTSSNLWMGIAGFHLYKATNEVKYLEFAKGQADFARSLQNNDKEDFNFGGIRLGSLGGPNVVVDQHLGCDLDQPAFYEIFTTEHNLDAYALFNMLYQETKEEKYKEARDKVLDWLKRVAHNKEEHRFNRGDKRELDTAVATYIHSWGVSALGVDLLDTFETGLAEKMITFVEKNCMYEVSYIKPDSKKVKVKGVDFIDYKTAANLCRRPLVSPEWTFQLINAYRRLELDFRRRGDTPKESRYREKREYLLRSILGLVIELNCTLAYPYDTEAEAIIGHEYNTPKEGTLSTIGDAYAILGLLGFDPLVYLPSEKKKNSPLAAPFLNYIVGLISLISKKVPTRFRKNKLPKTCPLPVTKEAQSKAEKKFGRNRILTDIEIKGFDIRYPKQFLEDHYEVIRQRLEKLELLFGWAPPELKWRLVITTDLTLTQGQVAAVNLGKTISKKYPQNTVFINPYYFEISQKDLQKEGLNLEQIQLKILYHELKSHITKKITNEEDAMRDTEEFMGLLKRFHFFKSLMNSFGLIMGIRRKDLSTSRSLSPVTMKFAFASISSSKIKLSLRSRQTLMNWIRGLTRIAFILINLKSSLMSFGSMWRRGRYNTAASSLRISTLITNLKRPSLKAVYIEDKPGLPLRILTSILLSITTFGSLIIEFLACLFANSTNFFIRNRSLFEVFPYSKNNLIQSFRPSFIFKFTHQSDFVFNREFFDQFLYLIWVQFQNNFIRHIKYLFFIKYNIDKMLSQESTFVNTYYQSVNNETHKDSEERFGKNWTSKNFTLKDIETAIKIQGLSEENAQILQERLTELLEAITKTGPPQI